MAAELRDVLQRLTDLSEVSKLAKSVLYSTVLKVGKLDYAITEFEVYLDSDPYSHRDNLQINSTCKWYFHRSHGKKYRGGTFKGLDITCGPPGKAGGILIRAISRMTDRKYVDGPCKVVDTILDDLEAQSIYELVSRPEFDLDAFSGGLLALKNSTQNLPQHEVTEAPSWKGHATAVRVGLSDAHPAFRSARLRILSLAAVRSTTKRKGDILRALVEDYGIETAAVIACKSVKQMCAYAADVPPPSKRTRCMLHHT